MELDAGVSECEEHSSQTEFDMLRDGSQGGGSVSEVVRDKSGEAEYQMATLHVGTLGGGGTHSASLGGALIMDQPQFCLYPESPPRHSS